MNDAQELHGHVQPSPSITVEDRSKQSSAQEARKRTKDVQLHTDRHLFYKQLA